jgi:hypothetical protein
MGKSLLFFSSLGEELDRVIQANGWKLYFAQPAHSIVQQPPPMMLNIVTNCQQAID